jgi:hypothetical protein
MSAPFVVGYAALSFLRLLLLFGLKTQDGFLYLRSAISGIFFKINAQHAPIA